MAQKKLGEYAVPNDDFIRAPITQPAVEAENYEIKPNLLTLVQQNQFGGSASEDSGMHLNTFTEICDMMRIKDVDPDAIKLRLFPFSLRGRAKDWLLALPKGTITSWEECTNIFMTKFFPPAKTMQLRSNITGFRQEDREPLALAWERMKEAVMSCPSHGMEEWLILHLFYNGLNPMSKSMLDTAAGGTFMSKQVSVAKKLLDDMQSNHAQWHVERSSSRKVNVVTEEKNEELTSKVDELIHILKGKEAHVNAITNSNVEEVDFIARNPYNPAWKSHNYGSNFSKNYTNPAGVPNNNNYNNGGANNGNLQTENAFKIFMQAQTEQNHTLMKITENHETMLGNLSNQAIAIKNNVQALQDRTKTVEVQLGKIAESQTMILARFAGKPEPNPVEELKMMRIEKEGEKPEELDYSNAPSPDYSVEDLVRMITVKNPGLEGGDDAMYQQFVHQVACKVRELEDQYKKLAEKLPAKLDDIFEPTIKIHIGVNEIAALCDLGASVSTIPKTLFDKLNLGQFQTTELRLHLDDSTYKQVVGIKENIVVEIKGCPALIDLVIVDMPEDPIAPIILGRPFLRTIKALINLHEGNVRIGLPSKEPFVVHFPRKKKAKLNDDGVITLKANYFGVGVPLPKPK